MEGFIEDGKEAKAYFRCVNELTRIAMDKAGVGFGTTAACRNKALRWTVQEGNSVRALTEVKTPQRRSYETSWKQFRLLFSCPAGTSTTTTKASASPTAPAPPSGSTPCCDTARTRGSRPKGRSCPQAPTAHFIDCKANLEARMSQKPTVEAKDLIEAMTTRDYLER